MTDNELSTSKCDSPRAKRIELGDHVENVQILREQASARLRRYTPEMMAFLDAATKGSEHSWQKCVACMDWRSSDFEGKGSGPGTDFLNGRSLDFRLLEDDRGDILKLCKKM
jgi:hypothetical protein